MSLRRGALLVLSLVAIGARVVDAWKKEPIKMAQTCTPDQITLLRGRKCTNFDEVKTALGFSNIYKDPYPKLWYDTTIVMDRDCYVVFPSETERDEYELKTMTKEEAQANYGPKLAYLTHKGGCGVCSTLDDLAVYLHERDLTGPVRQCALKLFEGASMACLRALKFTEPCSRIWFYNTRNTRKFSTHGGCFGVCITHILAPNNIPHGSYNPCQPPKELLNTELSVVGDDEGAGMSPNPSTDFYRHQARCLPPSDSCKGCVTPSYNDNGLCRNTVNGKPACHPHMWQNNEYRLNPCLQCDGKFWILRSDESLMLLTLTLFLSLVSCQKYRM